MKVIGIIAEYNPFHNGHAYQIKKIKEQTQADFVVVAMSGNFVQRGAPAIVDKYVRTKMTLSCGADLVIELPVLWATASAEAFAMAGVTLFDKMGCVDGICFGAESDDLDTLSMLAEVLIEEPDAYRIALSSYLKEGLAFPVARSKALCDYLTGTDNANQIASILDTPNNILAIEYLKALKRRNSSMTPYVIKREGAGYHDTEIPACASICSNNDNPACATTYSVGTTATCSASTVAVVPTASATAIRKELSNVSLSSAQPAANMPFDHPLSKAVSNCQLPEILATTMPAPALAVLKGYLADNALVQTNDFSSILGYRLLTTDVSTLADIGDSNADLANRMIKNRMQFSSFEQFCELCKSKDITYTRISRVLLHLVLGITNTDYEQGKALDYIPYLRILGFKKDSSALLKELKATAQAPVISKLADAASLLDERAMWLLEKDIVAADLYTQVCHGKTDTPSCSEYTQEIVRI